MEFPECAEDSVENLRRVDIYIFADSDDWDSAIGDS